MGPLGKFDIKDILYKKKELDFNDAMLFQFDRMQGPNIYQLLYEEDLQRLYNVATSNRFSGNIEKKYKALNDIVSPRGFTTFHRGTNRVVYKFYENRNILLKVGVDRAGCTDGIREFKNQELLKPFVTKVFSVHPSGASINERVIPITSYREFSMVSDNYYDLMTKFFIGKYVMEDIGEKYFMNWGIRLGFGLVLLDYPYLFELDSQKLICRNKDPKNPMMICGGEIDYDLGFNNLICTKCGKRYLAKELAKLVVERKIDMYKKNNNPIKVRLVDGNGNVVSTSNMTSKAVLPPEQVKASINSNKNKDQSKKKINNRHGKTVNKTFNIGTVRVSGLSDDRYKQLDDYKNMTEAQQRTLDDIMSRVGPGASPMDLVNAVVDSMKSKGMSDDIAEKVKTAARDSIKENVSKQYHHDHEHCHHEHEEEHDHASEPVVVEKQFNIEYPETVEKQFNIEYDDEPAAPTATDYKEFVQNAVNDVEIDSIDPYADNLSDDTYKLLLDKCNKDMDFFKHLLRNKYKAEPENNEEVVDIEVEEEGVDTQQETEVITEYNEEENTEVTEGEKKMGKVEFERTANYEADKYLKFYIAEEQNKSVMEFKKQIIELIDTLLDENKADVPAILDGKSKEDFAEQFADDFIKMNDIANLFYEYDDEPVNSKRKYSSSMEEF